MLRKEQTIVAIVAILAIAGSAAGIFIVISELDLMDSYGNIIDDGNRMAPGTKLTYDVRIEQNGAIIKGISVYEVLGQNPSGFMYRLSYDLTNPEGTEYEVADRIRLTNDGSTTATNTGSGNISTISGKLKMPYIEYVSSGETYRDYYNPFTNMMYLSISQNSSSSVELISMDAVWQPVDSYSPSTVMGYETVYNVSGISSGVGISGTYSEIIVAEDGNGKIGIRSLSTYGDYSTISYFFNIIGTDGIQNTGSSTKNTIDGSKDLSIYSYTIDDVDYKRYIDEDTGICYLLQISNATDSLTLELSSYGINNYLWS